MELLRVWWRGIGKHVNFVVLWKIFGKFQLKFHTFYNTRNEHFGWMNVTRVLLALQGKKKQKRKRKRKKRMKGRKKEKKIKKKKHLQKKCFVKKVFPVFTFQGIQNLLRVDNALKFPSSLSFQAWHFLWQKRLESNLYNNKL